MLKFERLESNNKIDLKTNNTSWKHINISGTFGELACSSSGEQIENVTAIRYQGGHLGLWISLWSNSTPLGKQSQYSSWLGMQYLQKRNPKCLSQSEARVDILDFDSHQKETVWWINIKKIQPSINKNCQYEMRKFYITYSKNLLFQSKRLTVSASQKQDYSWWPCFMSDHNGIF